MDYDIYALVYLLPYLIFSLFSLFLDAEQKFEHQPKQKQPESVKLAETTSETTLLLKHQSIDEQRRRERSGNSEQRRQDFASSRSYSDGQTSKHNFSDRSNESTPREDLNKLSHANNTEQRGGGSLFSDSRDAEQRRDGGLFSDSRDGDLPLSNLDTYRVNKAPVHHEQRALPTKAEG